ncbi:hypothetical protein [Streptomyces antibioticus]
MRRYARPGGRREGAPVRREDGTTLRTGAGAERSKPKETLA